MTRAHVVGSALKAAESSSRSVARCLDRLPVAPKALGEFAAHLHIHYRRRVAKATSPRWNELEQRRMPGGFSRWQDYLEQVEIERDALPNPAWLKLAYAAQRISAEHAVRVTTRVAQRAGRGWSDEDLWSLDGTLCRTLGAQLIALAAQSNGYPAEGWADGEEWFAALRHHGSILSEGRGGIGAARDARIADVRESLYWVGDHHQHLGW